MKNRLSIQKRRPNPAKPTRFNHPRAKTKAIPLSLDNSTSLSNKLKTIKLSNTEISQRTQEKPEINLRHSN